MLTARPEAYTAVPPDKPGRITTMLTLAPDERFLLVGSSIDEAPTANPDGSPILSVQRNGMPHSIFSNAPDPDGLAVFSVDKHGALGEPMFQDAGGSSPWCPLFLNHRPNQFVIALATADAVVASNTRAGREGDTRTSCASRHEHGARLPVLDVDDSR